MEYPIVLTMLATYFAGVWVVAAIWKKRAASHEPPPKGGRSVQRESFAEFHARVQEVDTPSEAAAHAGLFRRTA